ncbi:MAG: hypothetical protein K6A97_09655 [Lachnospiraceae bacterium]|nr:hypothetical protein [Lachnospiraceae bacterium]
MKKLFFKCILLAAVLYIPVVGMNIVADSANLFRSKMVREMGELLSAGNIVKSPGDFDEGELQKVMISSDEFDCDTVVIGSSSVLYVPWEDGTYVAGLSGSYLKDMIAVIGILESENKLPKKVIIGMDPWNLKEDSGEGRHTSIAKYADYELSVMRGEPSETSKKYLRSSDIGNLLEKGGELFSFSYFQSSLKLIMKAGIKGIPSLVKKEVVTLSEEEALSVPALFPNLRRSEVNFESEYEMDNEAFYYVAEHSIMYLGDRYDDISKDNVELFDLMLKGLKEKGIEVEIYISAMYPVLYDFIEETGDYDGVIKTEEKIREFATQYGFKVCGSFDPDALGFSKADFSDVFHLTPESGLKNYYIVLE